MVDATAAHGEHVTRLYIGVHNVPGSGIIELATQAACPGGWVLGPRYPATHAFVVVEDQWRWRLDGAVPASEWRPYNGPAAQERLFRIIGSDASIEAGVARARSMVRIPYGWDEVAASAGAAAMGLIPWRARLPWLGKTDPLKESMICTRIAMEVLREVSPRHREMVDGLPNLFPETLAKALSSAHGLAV